jgi:hypothetical protein
LFAHPAAGGAEGIAANYGDNFAILGGQIGNHLAYRERHEGNIGTLRHRASCQTNP